jgi:hypothetical protein
LNTLDYNKPDPELKTYFSLRHDGKNTYRNVLSLGDRSSNRENLEKFKDCIEENENNGVKEIRRVARLKKAGEVPKIPKMEYVEFNHMWKDYIGKKLEREGTEMPPIPYEQKDPADIIATAIS